MKTQLYFDFVDYLSMDDELEKNILYLVVSGLQKAVRRSLPVQAVNLAKIFHRIDPARCWKRLWTVLMEDCAGDLETLWMFFDFRGNSREFDDLIPLIHQMAVGKKTRDTAQIKTVLTSSSFPLWYHAALSASKHAKILELRKSWESKKMGCLFPVRF